MRIISVVFTLKTDKIDEFRSIIAEHARASLAEAGCRQFDVAVDPANPARFFLYEVYDDQAAFAAHQASAHYKQNAPRLGACAASRERNDFDMLPGGKPKR